MRLLEHTYSRRVSELLFVVLVGWATLVMIDLVTDYFAPRELTLEEVPEYLKLKSSPQDVLYAETYETESGTITKYAYADVEVPPEEGEDIGRRTPNSKSEVLEVVETEEKKIETVRTTFYASPQFYDDGERWRQIEYATTTPEVFAASGAIKYVERREWWERLLPGKPLFAQASTFYPDADPETNSVDGNINGTGSDFGGGCTTAAVFTTARNAATGLANDSGTGITVQSQADSEFGCTASINRGVFLFDTSSLDDGITIDSAVFSVYVTAVFNADNDGDDFIRLVTSAPALGNGLISGDYDAFSTTALASDVDITGITTSAYLDMTLNGTGESQISLIGQTKLGLREGHDILNSVPINSIFGNEVSINAAETSGTSQDPKLVVTYTGDANFAGWEFFPF